MLTNMAYDEKFRLRVIKYKDSGHTFKEVYEAFGVDSQRYYCWKNSLMKQGLSSTRRQRNAREK